MSPLTPKQLPTPVPPRETPGGWSSFSPLEWTVLTNRARSFLKALEQCEATSGGYPCEACLMAGIPSGGCRFATCRSSFHRLEQHLAHPANQVPEPERQQLRRTVDSLHLAYHHLDLKEERHG